MCERTVEAFDRLLELAKPFANLENAFGEYKTQKHREFYYEAQRFQEQIKRQSLAALEDYKSAFEKIARAAHLNVQEPTGRIERTSKMFFPLLVRQLVLPSLPRIVPAQIKDMIPFLEHLIPVARSEALTLFMDILNIVISVAQENEADLISKQLFSKMEPKFINMVLERVQFRNNFKAHQIIIEQLMQYIDKDGFQQALIICNSGLEGCAPANLEKFYTYWYGKLKPVIGKGSVLKRLLSISFGMHVNSVITPKYEKYFTLVFDAYKDKFTVPALYILTYFGKTAGPNVLDKFTDIFTCYKCDLVTHSMIFGEMVSAYVSRINGSDMKVKVLAELLKRHVVDANYSKENNYMYLLWAGVPWSVFRPTVAASSRSIEPDAIFEVVKNARLKLIDKARELKWEDTLIHLFASDVVDRYVDDHFLILNDKPTRTVQYLIGFSKKVKGRYVLIEHLIPAINNLTLAIAKMLDSVHLLDAVELLFSYLDILMTRLKEQTPLEFELMDLDFRQTDGLSFYLWMHEDPMFHKYGERLLQIVHNIFQLGTSMTSVMDLPIYKYIEQEKKGLIKYRFITDPKELAGFINNSTEEEKIFADSILPRMEKGENMNIKINSLNYICRLFSLAHGAISGFRDGIKELRKVATYKSTGTMALFYASGLLPFDKFSNSQADMFTMVGLANVSAHERNAVMESLKTTSNVDPNYAVQVMCLLVQRMVQGRAVDQDDLNRALDVLMKFVELAKFDIFSDISCMYMYTLSLIIGAMKEFPENKALSGLLCRLRTGDMTKMRERFGGCVEFQPVVTVLFTLMVKVVLAHGQPTSSEGFLSQMMACLSQMMEFVPIQISLKHMMDIFTHLSSNTKILNECLQTIPLVNEHSFFLVGTIAANFEHDVCNDYGETKLMLLSLIGSMLDYESVPAIREFLSNHKVTSMNPLRTATRIKTNQNPAAQVSVFVCDDCDDVIESEPESTKREHESLNSRSRELAMELPYKAKEMLTYAIELCKNITDVKMFHYIYYSVEPWIEKVKLTSVEECLSIFRPAFNEISEVSIRYCIINKFFEPFLDNDIFIKCIVENLSWGTQEWLQLVDVSNNNSCVIQWLILMISEHHSSIFVDVISQCLQRKVDFLDSDLAILYFIYVIFDRKNDPIIRNTIMQLQAYLNNRNSGIPAIDLNGTVFDIKSFVPNHDVGLACRFAVCTHNEKLFNNLLDLVDPEEINPHLFVKCISFALAGNHPFAHKLFAKFFTTNSPFVPSIAEVCLKSDSKELCEIAYQLINKNHTSLYVDCVTRGLLPLSVLKELTDTDDCSSEDKFWISRAKGVASDAAPSEEQLKRAVLFADRDVLEIIQEAIPCPVRLEPLLPYILQRFDEAYILIEKADDEMLNDEMMQNAEEIQQGIPLCSIKFAEAIMNVMKVQ